MGQDGNWTAGEVIAMSGAYWAGCALQAAVRLDLFSALDDGEKDLKKLAGTLGCDERGLGMLLTALVSLGFLRRQQDRYLLPKDARRLLVKNSPDYIGHIILHHYSLLSGWAQLHDAVRTGLPTVEQRASTTEDATERENFLLGMFNIASMQAGTVAAGIDLEGVSRLLDLGGGPGTYAVAFCQAKSDLAATIFDLPTTRPVAETIIDRYGMRDRVDFVGGDFDKDALPGGFDLVWMSQILHGCDRYQGAAGLVARAAASLNPGGRVCIQEFALEDDRSGPVHSALFGLNMLVGTEGGQVFTLEELAAMLREAGAVHTAVLELDLPNGCRVVCGRFA